MTGKRDKFKMAFRATEMEAREAIAGTSEWLQATDLTQDQADEVEIALAEAINNVVEHAYVDSEPGPVRILCSLRRTHLDIRICDTGTPLPQNRLPPGLAADVSVARADLPEGGFGWFLIRKLTSDIRYDRYGLINHLSLRFDLKENDR
jgi:serine/threonine-protein kinase RsbW